MFTELDKQVWALDRFRW